MNDTPIPGFTGYFVTAAGDVISTQQGRRKVMKPSIVGKGRKCITLKGDNGRMHRKAVATFVLLAFVGPRPEGAQACHNNGNCADDRPENLRWDTHAANMGDKVKHGTSVKVPRGTAHHNSKLDDETVKFIRSSPMSDTEIAKWLGVTAGCIIAVRECRTWTHVVG